MAIRIEEVGDEKKEVWNRAVRQSPQATFFHEYNMLTALQRHFDAELHLLIGYVGEEPIGVFPIFGQSKGPFLLATSPPLSVEVHVGPAMLNFEKLKQRKVESRHQEFINNSIDWIESEMDPDLYEIKITDRYLDVRPFLRRDFDVVPSYTYILDLSPDLDELQDQFSSDARRNIQKTPDDAYQIREEGTDAIEEIVSLIRQRFDELEEYYYLESDLVVDLYTSSEDGTVRPYTCRIDGEIASGIIALEDEDTVYRWQGGSKPDTDVPVNELLDWHIIRDSKERNKKRYDFVGAMIPRLCAYKSKFGPRPATLYIARKRTPMAKASEEVYRRMPNAVREIVGL